MDDEKLKYKKIDGLNLAYLEVQMTDGTICDLNGEHRLTKVLYVCYQHGKNEIYSLKETSTCNYEIIILTSKLCEHPKYKPKDSDENVINCVALEGSPKTPKGLAEMEVSRLKVQKILVSMHYCCRNVPVPPAKACCLDLILLFCIRLFVQDMQKTLFDTMAIYKIDSKVQFGFYF